MKLIEDSKLLAMERTRIIVGLDFGTTHTGLAFADTSSNSNETLQARTNKIKVIKKFPGHGKEVCKVPSRIAYRSENQHVVRPALPVNDREIFWGFEVQPGWTQYSWFKLRLDQDSRVTGFDDRSLRALARQNEGIMQLPDGKSPITVCQEYLFGVFQVLEEKLRGEYGAILDETPIDFYVTVPAIWGEPAKRHTKSSARRAGFGRREGDKIIIITEPEAAATLALSAYSGCGILNQVHEGNGLMVVDLGGGTADTTTYLITEAEPEIKFRELIVGEGGKVGSTAVNRSFHDFCVGKFGDAFTALPFYKTGPGSTFMNAFEDRKHAFDGQNGLEDVYEVPLYLRDVADGDNYDSDERSIKFTRDDMESFFKPSVAKIVKLIKSQLANARRAMPDGGKINLCIFVGGYSESRYLQSVLRQECNKLGVDARFPHEPQAAIVKGAVLRGLGGVSPDVRCCRRHYGFSIAKPFREATDPDYLSFMHDYHQVKYCKGRMSWAVEKGDPVHQSTTIEKTIEWLYHENGNLTVRYPLYGCSKDLACKYITHIGVEKVGEIVVDFTDVSVRHFDSKVVDGVKLWKIIFCLEVGLGHEEGLLRVRALVGGREIAKASFDFDHIENGGTDTTPDVTIPGAPARRVATATRAVPRSPAATKKRTYHAVASRTSTPRMRANTISVSHSGSLPSPHSSPKKRKILHMDYNELSKAEDSE